MRILVLHNHYQQSGGEDTVVARESDLLRLHGNDVYLHEVSNNTVNTLGERIAVAWRASYSSAARQRVAHIIGQFRPDVVHVHNFFPLLTPSVYEACRAARIPVVQSLHNYRLLCLNACFLRKGRVCEDCLGKSIPWPGVLHACYRGSRAASGTVAMMLTAHRLRRTWIDKVDLYVALTDFCRAKFIEGGLPSEKIVVKPNFVCPDPGARAGHEGQDYALFVGRLSPEKGLDVLLNGWSRLGGGVPLKIVGDGPLAQHIVAATRKTPALEWLGKQPQERVFSLMRGARFLVLPSVYYESFPAVIAEAYATGLPIVASNLGSMASLILDGHTGLLFSRGDSGDLAAKVSWLWGHPRRAEEMGREARRQFEQKYGAERNYQLLTEIYTRVVKCSRLARASLYA